jgi:glycerol-3-phosphate dehydrogenase
VSHILIVGGGINGVMSAWSLARRGHDVELHERDTLMSATSSASTKLIHGGLRYLENREFRLVRESLHERAWWLEHASELVSPIPLLLPVYHDHERGPWLVRLGLWLYDRLAGQKNIAPHQWLSVPEVAQRCPHLKTDGLRGAFLFYDAQMDDHKLGLWAAEQAREAGTRFYEHSPVERIGTDGSLQIGKDVIRADLLINAAGPWARKLMDTAGVETASKLDLVRGSHLVVDRPCQQGLFLQVPHEQRICFLLPWKGKSLIGTTEVRQELDDPISCSQAEVDYLLAVHNHYVQDALDRDDILDTFAGLRPLFDSGSKDPGKTTREYELEWHGRSLHIFGGKWTSSRVLAERVADEAERVLGRS